MWTSERDRKKQIPHTSSITLMYICFRVTYFLVGPNSVVISHSLRAGQSSSRFETSWRRESRNWGPLSLLYNGYRVIPGGKPAGPGVHDTPPSSAEVKEEKAIVFSPLWLHVMLKDEICPFVAYFF
jgi:hypothetical protein